MNCSNCQHANPPDAHFCANCGVRVVAHTGDHAAIGRLVDDAPHDTTAALPHSAPTTPIGAPPLASRPEPPRQYHEAPTQLTAGRRASVWPIVITVAAVTAIVAMGAILVLSGDGDTSVASVTTELPATTDGRSAEPIAVDADAPASVATSSVAATDVPATTPTVTDPAAVETTVPTTTPPTTATPTTAPPVDPAAVPPVPPEPGPINAPGSPQVLANVSPSGLPFADSAAAFAIAQEFGDALALENWDVARALSPELADNSDDDFAVGYAGTNRVSLILVDARRAGPEIELLVVSVAVELGGDQTTLYCLRWFVDPEIPTVRQDGGGQLARWQANAQPEAIRNDAAALATVQQCDWP